MRKYTIFYSWQSDLPNATNRGFIEKSLENAAKAIRTDDSLKVEPVVDRDIRGVPGSPDIGRTILDKIDQAHIFVADISIINRGEKRLSPNPNVLIELGYAMKALGPDKYLLVMNTAYGIPEELPFDLRMKYVITYELPEEATERAPGRKVLESKLEGALRTIIIKCEATPDIFQGPSITDQLRLAIKGNQANQANLARKYMDDLLDRIATLAPDFSTEEERDELLLRAIDNTKPLITEFCHIVELMASMNAASVALAVYKGFGKLLERYNTPAGFSGSSIDSDFDFFKFVGHEMFVDFFSMLIKEDRWETIADLLDNDLHVRNAGMNREGTASFDYASEHVRLLDDRNKRLELRRVSLHADILKARYEDGDISQLVSFEDFMEADYFLFLRGIIQETDTSRWLKWRPWSSLYMSRKSPKYLLEASLVKNAEKLLRPLGVKDVDSLKQALLEKSGLLGRMYSGRSYSYDHPLSGFNVSSIGCR